MTPNHLKRNGLLLGLLLLTSAEARTSFELGGEWTVVGPDTLLQGVTERPTLTLDGRSELSGFTGCNRLTGRFAARGDVFLTAGLGLTKRVCVDGAAMEVEAALLGRLNRLTRYTLEGDLLTLKGSAGEVLLRRTSPRLGLPATQGQPPRSTPEVPMTDAPQPPRSDEASAVTWQVRSFKVGGRSYAVPAATFSLTSGEGQPGLSGSLGCNQLTLSAEHNAAQPDGEWVFTGMRSSRMACSPELSAAETALTGFLRGAVKVQQTADRVTFSSVNGELVLERAQATEVGAELAAGDWATEYRGAQLELGGRQVTLTPPVTVRFGEQPDGTLELRAATGCNGLFGLGQPQGAGWTFGQLGASLMLCPDMGTEEAIGQLFQSPVTLQRDGDVVVLRSEQGQLRLTPQAAQGESSESEQPAGEYRLTALQRGGQPVDLGGFSEPVRLSLTPGTAGAAGSVGGLDGCNSFGGMYRLEGQTLHLEGTLVSTMKFCESTETMPQLTETLAAAPQVEQQGDTLILTANDLRWEFVRQ